MDARLATNDAIILARPHRHLAPYPPNGQPILGTTAQVNYSGVTVCGNALQKDNKFVGFVV